MKILFFTFLLMTAEKIMADDFKPFTASTASESKSFTVFTGRMKSFSPLIKQVGSENQNGKKYLYFDVFVESDVLIDQVLALRQDSYFDNGEVKYREHEPNKLYFQEKKLIKLNFFFNKFGCIETECNLEERKKNFENGDMKNRLNKMMYYFVHNIEPSSDEGSWSPISFDISKSESINTGLKKRNLK